ncbi:hypothetical protein ACIQU5_24075 [Streptomyces sp. NPDC090306]|uniref:hypothetical protein n=1 Tax=Streptomyces sp. NPDC090306 TaxID=3365961 RepID=UPI00381C0C55
MDERFTEQLKSNGVEVEQVTALGVLHGHFPVTGFDAAYLTVNQIGARLCSAASKKA